ncbi:MAG: hypothetical protein WA208_20730 [Thermoanaerobaculia bacterium]
MNRTATKALISFFADPKDNYTRSDVRAIFEPDTLASLFEEDDCVVMERVASEGRARVADFIFGFVNPLDIAAAIATVDPASELTAEPVTVKLPRWVVRELGNAAKAQKTTLERMIASELLVAIEGERSAEFEGAEKIDYAAVTISAEAQR